MTDHNMQHSLSAYSDLQCQQFGQHLVFWESWAYFGQHHCLSFTDLHRDNASFIEGMHQTTCIWPNISLAPPITEICLQHDRHALYGGVHKCAVHQ